MDWYSRYVLSWELSNTLDNGFCITALETALQKYGQPEIFNSDQGCQFTANNFTAVLLDKNIRISMDGQGRAIDNIFIERFWRSVKYEEVYLADYQCGQETYRGLDRYNSPGSLLGTEGAEGTTWNNPNQPRTHTSESHLELSSEPPDEDPDRIINRRSSVQ